MTVGETSSRSRFLLYSLSKMSPYIIKGTGLNTDGEYIIQTDLFTTSQYKDSMVSALLWKVTLSIKITRNAL